MTRNEDAREEREARVVWVCVGGVKGWMGRCGWVPSGLGGGGGGDEHENCVGVGEAGMITVRGTAWFAIFLRHLGHFSCNIFIHSCSRHAKQYDHAFYLVILAFSIVKWWFKVNYSIVRQF